MIIIAGIMFTIWPKLDDKEKEKNNHWWAAVSHLKLKHCFIIIITTLIVQVLIMVSTFFQASAIVYMEKNLKYNVINIINVFSLLIFISLLFFLLQ